MENENNGIMTKVWGPSGWHFLHCVTFGYPIDPDKFNAERGYTREEDKVQTKYKNFFRSVGHILPCRYCRNSYLEYIGEPQETVSNLSVVLPPGKALKSRLTLVRWLYDIHNKVNTKLNDSVHTDFVSFYNTYDGFRAKCSTKNANGCIKPLWGKKMRTVVFTYYESFYWILLTLIILNLVVYFRNLFQNYKA